MKPTNTLLSHCIIAVGAVAGYQQNHSDPQDNSINVANGTAAGRGHDLAALNGYVTWLSGDDDQEVCGNAKAKAIGSNVILKSDCQQIVDYMSTKKGYWKIEGYVRGGAFGNLDAIDFVQQAMRMSPDADRLPTVIGNVNCAGENSPSIEWRVGLPPSSAVLSRHTSAVGWVAVILLVFAFAIA
ncbi:hypothetical protein Daus18300_004308 [Diaporthe australafricana]|uniref:Ecp2 effector protein domain-containing protein n=1 Tax=Diaporthe australafricana TaxID=127596 RepID=A0ABR3X9P2_9PEZI